VEHSNQNCPIRLKGDPVHGHLLCLELHKPAMVQELWYHMMILSILRNRHRFLMQNYGHLMQNI